MDNKNIGKLIASLRKKQGLTQQELGDKVGVGFRAVSKWERGLTLPDISIINDLSKILGISSDELLSGKLNKNNSGKTRNKISAKTKKNLYIVLAIIVVFVTTLILYQNKTYEYKMESVSEEYSIDGTVTFRGNKISIIVNSIEFKDKDFSSTIIKNYEYDIVSGDNFIFRYGFIETIESLLEPTTVEEFSKIFNINYEEKNKVNKEKIIQNNIKVKIKFLNEEDKTIIKEIEISLI